MRIAVISDIHGNAAAFRSVLEDIDACETDNVFCLGDIIGYGPEPETVAGMLRRRNITSVTGNHELVLKNPDFLGWFNPYARQSLEKTMSVISAATSNYLAGLPYFTTAFNCRFVHGFPPDSPTNYMYEMHPKDTEKIILKMTENICFIGHTHELAIIEFNGETVEMSPLGRQTLRLNPECRYIINAGSVGQPRDGTAEAKYIIFDDTACSLEARYVAYDVSETVNKIYAAGLPEQHALRLMGS